jgi:hypothetical protein
MNNASGSGRPGVASPGRESAGTRAVGRRADVKRDLAGFASHRRATGSQWELPPDVPLNETGRVAQLADEARYPFLSNRPDVAAPLSSLGRSEIRCSTRSWRNIATPAPTGEALGRRGLPREVATVGKSYTNGRRRATAWPGHRPALVSGHGWPREAHRALGGSAVHHPVTAPGYHTGPGPEGSGGRPWRAMTPRSTWRHWGWTSW